MPSTLETLLASQLQSAGLPAPEREMPFMDERAFRFDFAWPAASVAVEVQGGIWTRGRHGRGAGIAKDCEKLSEAAVRGWRVLPVTGDMVRSGRACALVERALEGLYDEAKKETL